jgi:hypothetical protein
MLFCKKDGGGQGGGGYNQGYGGKANSGHGGYGGQQNSGGRHSWFQLRGDYFDSQNQRPTGITLTWCVMQCEFNGRIYIYILSSYLKVPDVTDLSTAVGINFT